MPTAVLNPYPIPFAAPTTSQNFYGGAGSSTPTAPTTGSPIMVGSPTLGLGIPQPGGTLSINDFGLDVDEMSWVVPTAQAATIKPNPRDKHPYISNLFCDSSTSTRNEGLMSTIRATYKGCISGTIRPAKRAVSINTRADVITLPDSDLGLTGGVLYMSVQPIKVPSFIYTLRGASLTQPDDTQTGNYFPVGDSGPPGAPTVPATFSYPYYIEGNLIFTFIYSPHPTGWLLEKQDWNEAALCFEVTQQYNLEYRLSNVTAPAPPSGS